MGQKARQYSSNEAMSGTSRRQSQAKDFEKALEQATSREPRGT